MSDRKQALQDLLAKVEAGDVRHSTDLPFWKVWLPESDIGSLAYTAAKAFDGSLDAAKALHEAVLPEWCVNIYSNRLGNWRVSLDSPVAPHKAMRGLADNPARAWLCALLKSLIAEADT